MRYIISTIIIIGVIVLAYFAFFRHAAAPSSISTTTPSQEGSTTGNNTAANVEYRNTQYGFAFELPKDWQGFSVRASSWTGQVFNKNGVTTRTETGPLISISAPASTGIKQNIPIMVFTKAQWDLALAGNSSTTPNEFLSLGAAPIPPSKIGENSNYVFAIPARFDYAFPPGFQKVEQIIASNTPLKTF